MARITRKLLKAVEASKKHDDPPIAYELLHLIVENLANDKASLCAVSLSSEALRQEAQRMLFCDVTTLTTVKAHTSFLNSVAASPTRLALFVRSYKLVGVSHEEELFTELFDALYDGLEMMRNLKDLEVWATFHMVKYLSYAQTLEQCSFSRLERFEWMLPRSFTHDVMRTFLSQQAMLKHLGITVSYHMSRFRPQLTSIPPTTCPELISLVGNLAAFRVFLPGRKITTLSLVPDNVEPIEEQNVNTLVTEFSLVKAFSCPSDVIVRTDMPGSDILRYLPSINVLKIDRLRDKEDPLLDIAGLLRMISKLPALQKLVLSTSTWEDNIQQPVAQAATWIVTLQEEDGQFFHRIFENSCENLQWLDVKIGPGVYTRYTRSGEGMREISGEEAKEWAMTS